MAMFSRSTKPRPGHQPRVEALEERLALNVGTAHPPVALQSPAAIGKTNSGTATPAAAVTVPFKGSIDYTRIGPGSEPGSLVFIGTGHATHTGLSTIDAVVVPHREETPPTYSVSGVITAANGDQINFSGNATFTSPTTAIGTAEITGGTGRFENATGVLDFTDEFAMADGVIVADHQTITGSISF